MNLSLMRFEFTQDSTIGRLFLDDMFLMWTLEDQDRDGPKVYGETCIPEGTYRVVIDWSNRFNRRMPHVLDVPGFEGVRIHPGNTSKDTQGCILVGNTHEPNFVGDSRRAFNDLFENLDVAEHQEDQTIYLYIAKEA